MSGKPWIVFVHDVLIVAILRHTFTTRLLFSCISASLYHGDETLDGLLDELVLQGLELYHTGFEATIICANY